MLSHFEVTFSRLMAVLKNFR